ncbi:MAG: methyltransferase domain-containing protein [Candidatus Eisenbacteria bacterium]|nr:methyltransferase domain-containing protein [Candidatus Eisenbacteria bacterium]
MSAIEQIHAYRRISPDLATAGQPTGDQIEALAAAGFEVVINLLPASDERALSDECARVCRHGMTYVYVPVVWGAPTAEALYAFIDALRFYRGRRIFAHCAANLRVSVFLALYRVIERGWNWRAAAADLRRIWRPNEIWSEFISEILREREIRENPWQRVPLADYEAHMGSSGADQLAPLAAVLERHCGVARPRRVAVLGCAAGNGLERLDPARIARLVGIDIQSEYLREARRRFAAWGARLHLIRARATATPLRDGSLELVSAGLIFEYCDPAVLARRSAELLVPGGHLSVVLQRGGEAGMSPVSRTPQTSLEELEPIMRLVPPETLEALLRAEGLEAVEREEIPLRAGKAFFAGLYRKTA